MATPSGSPTMELADHGRQDRDRVSELTGPHTSIRLWLTWRVDVAGDDEVDALLSGVVAPERALGALDPVAALRWGFTRVRGAGDRRTLRIWVSGPAHTLAAAADGLTLALAGARPGRLEGPVARDGGELPETRLLGPAEGRAMDLATALHQAASDLALDLVVRGVALDGRRAAAAALRPDAGSGALDDAPWPEVASFAVILEGAETLVEMIAPGRWADARRRLLESLGERLGV